MAEFKTKFGIGDKVSSNCWDGGKTIEAIIIRNGSVSYNIEYCGGFKEEELRLFIEPYKPKYQAGDVLRGRLGGEYKIKGIEGENYLIDGFSYPEEAKPLDENMVLVARGPKFKNGDRIKHEGWGVGTVTGFLSHINGKNFYDISYDNATNKDGIESKMSPYVDPPKPKFKIGDLVKIKSWDLVGKVTSVNGGLEYKISDRFYFAESDLEPA